MTNIATALNQAREKLERLSNNESRIDAEILLCHTLNKNRAYLYAHPATLLTSAQYADFQEFIAQRGQGMPIAYIIGQRDFWTLTLAVTKHTLIPRHETERLVELALELRTQDSKQRILDLGTGSGAIALALASERPLWAIDACDYSNEALSVARANAHSLNITNVTFYLSNWFADLPAAHYDLIVANPPYIAEQDPHLEQGDLRFEPLSALVSAKQGLADLTVIAQQARQHLASGGLLLLEHGYDQKVQVHDILVKTGYHNIQCWQDIQGHDRVSGGWLY